MCCENWKNFGVKTRKEDGGSGQSNNNSSSRYDDGNGDFYQRKRPSEVNNKPKTMSLISLNAFYNCNRNFVLVTVLLFGLCCCFGTARAVTELPGQIVRDLKNLRLAESPYLVTGDVVVEREGEVRIDPGVELRFLSGVGITVRGVLKAEGLKGQVIRLTRNSDGGGGLTAPDFRVPSDIRLVDGPSINEGRLQMFHKGKWRSVCTNSRNWTKTDFEVACRQLGFTGGNFSRWFPRNNDSSQLAYEFPRCNYQSQSLIQCNWNSKIMGSGICDYHEDIGIQCEPVAFRPLQAWSGLRFDDAKYIQPNRLPRLSLSSLRHLEILYAGWNNSGNFTSALQISGVPPSIDSITVRWSAFTGINLTATEAPADLVRCLVSDNRGYGVYVNTSTGMVRLIDSSITSNGADGVKYVFHDVKRPIYSMESVDFCLHKSQGQSQLYPLVLNAISEANNSPNRKSCTQTLMASDLNDILTLHFSHIETTDVEGWGNIEVRDGQFPQSPLLINVTLRNESWSQSVSSTRGSLYIRFNPAIKAYTSVSLRLTSGKGKSYDLNVTGSTVKDNNGRGVAVENIRSMVHVVSSFITGNKHVAGVHVLGGVGDVNISRTEISSNIGDGVNISYSGGKRNITSCNLIKNTGRGLAVWLNDSRTYQPAEQYTVLAYSSLLGGGDVAVLMGNYCRPSFINITYNSFQDSDNVGLQIDTCWKKVSADSVVKVLVSNNRFFRLAKPALVIAPAVNIDAIVTYNRFEGNSKGALYVANPDKEELESLTSSVDIVENIFEGNVGHFVVKVGLSQYSLVQRLRFARNELRRNKIKERYSSLVARHRVAAVVTVSSSNVKLERNLFENPDSKYEIGSHLVDHYAVIDAQLCYFGKYLESESLKVYNRVFDSKDRYDLAQVLVTPYLLVPYKDEDRLISSNYSNQLVVDFQPDDSPFRIGGTVYGRQELPEGEYVVWRDVYVRSQSELVLNRKTTLKFAPSVGLMVQGKLTVQGEVADDDQKVIFTLDEQQIALEESEGSIIRLSNGQTTPDVRDGVLEVNVDGKWGTVCNYGWNFYSASLACAALGLVANPADWFLLRTQLVTNGQEFVEDNLPIVWSGVKCGIHDTDLANCEKEGILDFENSCTHAQDVVIRCYRQGWAGLRFGPMADRSDVRGARVERAGVLDWSTGSFRPAIQLDLNRHLIEAVTIGRNLHSGVGIVMADYYADVYTKRMTSCIFEANLGDGLVTRSSGLLISRCLVRDNRLNGILYDPSLSHEEQRDLNRWIDKEKSELVVTLTPSSIPIPSRRLSRGQQLFLIFDARTPTEINRTIFQLTTEAENTFGIQIFTQLHNGTNETVTITNGFKSSWDMRDDDLKFPMTTVDSELTFTYSRNQRHGYGNAILFVTAVERASMVPAPVPNIRVENSAISTNRRAGWASVHYSYSVGPLEERRTRIVNESIEIVRTKFRQNKMAAVLVDSPFFDIQDGVVANVTYVLNLTQLESNEGGALAQVSKDLHGGHNLFHWIVCHNQFQNNNGGGVELSLPYTAEYSSRTYHTAYLANNTFNDNRNFKLNVGGHYAKVELWLNRISNNVCYKGLLSFTGTEKEILIWENVFERNICEFVVEFYANSHADKFGGVPAVFKKNRVEMNRYGINGTNQQQTTIYSPRSYTLGLRGLQKVDVNNNLFINNTMDFEFLAGLITGSLASSVNCRENWWGTVDTYYIRKRIFDFDDWNSFAVAIFSPFSAKPEFYSSVVHETFNASGTVDLDNLGGRLYNSTYLRRRDRPYIIRSDLTVMPGSTLHIEAGVELQFFPSIGILVLGSLRAIGRESMPIHMKPFNKYTYYNTRYKREILPKMAAVRTCKGVGNCNSFEQGFMELYNSTTRQWVPICDPYFTQNNAEVVCKELGRDPMAAMFMYGPRVEMDPSYVSRVAFWPEPRLCSGSESSFSECSLRFSGFFQPSYPCSYKSDFVFVYCGQRNLEPGLEYWGGISFASPTFEPIVIPSYDSVYSSVMMEHSALEHVEIIGAGILHSQKCPAVLSVTRTPTTFMFVNISQSASHGVSVIAPTESMVLYGTRIENNLGIGINVAVLYGESRVSSSSSFSPLSSIHLPYNTFGLVDMCSADKILSVNQRVLVYYKYGSSSADCIKIFHAYGGLRRLGFRLLHFNLLNTTQLSPLPDSLWLFDGDLYSQSAPNLIAQLTSETEQPNTFFQSSKPVLTVRVDASGGTEALGFIAEVVTVPIMATGFREKHHNVTSCVISANVMGGVYYSNVGEIGPHVAILNSQLRQNGVGLYGNFSTAKAAVGLDLQNTDELYVQNNLFHENQGGLRVLADSETMAASLTAFVANNLFYRNRNWPSIAIRGRKTSPFQMAVLFRNAITMNFAPYNDVILLESLMLNFTYNYVVNNTGDHVMAVTSFDQVSQPSFQAFTYNSWWNNWALRWDERTTLLLTGSGQRIEENIFLNPYNDFEVMIRNISNISFLNPQHVARIDATNNWWGYNQSWAVSGRIWDGLDEPGIIQAVYKPFYINNETLINGKCPPGWRMIGRTCFIYIGGVMEYFEAESYCISINGSIPYVEKDNIYDILGFVARQQVNFDLRISSVWVRTLDTPIRGCSSLRGARDYITPCDYRLPVLCETDPDVYLDPSEWAKFSITYAAIGAVAATFLVVLIIVLFWLCKSRHRHQEKLDRRNSIRSSIRSASSRSLTGSTTFGSVDLTKKRLEQKRPVQLESVTKSNGSIDSITTKQTIGSIDSIAKKPNGSIDSIAKSSQQLNSSQEDNRSYEVFEAKNNQIEYPGDYNRYLSSAVGKKGRVSSEEYLDDTRTSVTHTPISSLGFGFDNKCYLETHFASEETGSTSTSSSFVDDPVETKRALERAGQRKQRQQPNGHSSSSSNSISNGFNYKSKPHILLETEM
ncbi:hypothetical protein CHUAL_006179 [Chamberlinius hualienensis]